MKPSHVHENKKAIAILRVSSHRQKDNSPSVQLREIEGYAANHGLEVVSVETIVESAKDAGDRRKYQEAIKKALRLKVHHLLYYMTDREGRNFTDIEASIKLIRQGLISVHYVRENKVLHKNSPHSDFMMRQFQALQDKQVSEITSIKTNDAQRAKAEQGWFPGNHAPAGYVHRRLQNDDGREKKRGTVIVVDPNRRAVLQVQREFELRAESKTLKEIRATIIAEGLVTLSKPYYVSSIEKRLKNKFYRGRFDWQGIEYEGRHDLIIPPHILNKVDESLGLKGRYTVKQRDGIFGGGWLRCGHSDCGCHVLWDPKTKRIQATDEVKTYRYYHCSNGRGIHDKQVNVEESKIWKQLGGAVEQISITEELAEKIAYALNETHRRVEVAVRREMGGYSSALDALEKKKDRLFDMRLTGEILDEEFRRHSARLTDERHEITALLEKAQLSINGAYLKTAQSILELATKAKSLWIQRSPEERRMLLEKILSNQVLDGPSVRYELKKPFSVLAEMGREENWRPLRDSNSCLLRERELS